MKRIIPVVILVGLLSSAAHAKAPFKTSDEKFGYAIGMNLGTTMKDTNVLEDPDQIAAGLKAALKGEPTRLSVSEMGQTLTKYREESLKMEQRIAEEKDSSAEEKAKELNEYQTQAAKNERVAYAIGMNLGITMKANNVTADPDQIVAGLKAVLKDEPTFLTISEMGQALVDLNNERQVRQKKIMEEMNASADENIKKSKAYLAQNAKKAGVVTLASGLQYKVLASGDGASPLAGERVQVHYRGTLIDGTEFDSSYKYGEPVSFNVNRVIPGWTEALQLMKEGDKWELTIPSELAYGKKGAPPVVPPNAVLIFEVELLKVLK